MKLLCLACLVATARAHCALAGCPSWPLAVGTSTFIASNSEWLPNEATAWFGRACLRDGAASVAAAARAAGAASRAYDGPSFRDITIGKYLHFPTVWFLSRAAEINGTPPSLRVAAWPKAADAYARVSACSVEANAYACMFGTFDRTIPSDQDCAAAVWAAARSPAARGSAAAVFYAGVAASVLAPAPFAENADVHVRGATLVDGMFATIHARRGDACDRWANDSSPYGYHFFDEAHAEPGEARGRPCYAWNAYRLALGRARDAYGIRVALLLTEARGRRARAPPARRAPSDTHTHTRTGPGARRGGARQRCRGRVRVRVARLRQVAHAARRRLDPEPR